jgi:hypothetical protein
VLAGCHLAIGIRRTDGIEAAEPQQNPGENINLPAIEPVPTKPSVIAGDRGGSTAGNAAAGTVLPGTLELEGGHDRCVVGFGVLAVGGEGEGFVVKDFVVDL